MYGWIWQHLPGPTAAKAAAALVLVAAAVLLLFYVVFPWAVTWLPGQDVSVDSLDGVGHLTDGCSRASTC